MLNPSASSLPFLKKVQASVMDDMCNIYSVTLSSGTYSTSVTKTRTLVVSGVACGIQLTNGQIVQRGEIRFVDYDCMLRVQSDLSVKMSYEFDLIEKGDTIISGSFIPASQPVVNSSVQKIKLKRIVP
jgi:hypothetical protein